MVADEQSKFRQGGLSELAQAALHFAEQGYPVFPLRPRSKIPATENGLKDASTDLDQVRRWWGRNPDANIGLVTGPASRCWVLDIDNNKDGEASLRRLEADHGPLPETVETLTGSGGRHVWFRWPRIGPGPRNSASADCLGSGIDVRGEGGYVVAPPSIHPNGRKYECSVDSAEQMAAAPPWLLGLALKANQSAGSGRWREVVSNPIGEGKRNTSLTSVVGMLLRKDIDPYTTLELARALNAYRCQPPMDDREVVRIVDSIAGKELRRRGGIHDHG